jgi:ssDNA-binding Zn-finger/Zn-ribbon topoisomerase 1
MPAKECPQCGATMRLKHSDVVLRVPGQTETTKRSSAEWICPDCDYFEEAEEAEEETA